MSTFSILESYVSLRRTVALLWAAETKHLEFGHNQILVLYKLTSGSFTMGELVEATYSDKASMTRTVASLEESGLVKRKTDDQDRRVIRVELTPKGKMYGDKAREIRNALGQKLEETLSPTERKQFQNLIGKIIENVNQN